MSEVYAAAAWHYLAAGWSAFPLPPGKKFPPLKGCTGKGGRDLDEDEIKYWVEQRPTWNIGLRVPDGVIGFDADLYKAEGRENYEALVAKCGPLPDTWVSTSRDDGSGIHFFQVPLGTRLHGAFGGIEIIQWWHRYATVWPSIHPEGRLYRWDPLAGWVLPEGRTGLGAGLPWREDFTSLSDAWLAELTQPEAAPKEKRERRSASRPTAVGEPHTNGCWPSGSEDWAGPVKESLADALAAFRKGSRHDTARDAALALVRYESLGYPGAAEAIEALGRTFRGLIVDRAKPADADKEWNDLLVGARKLVGETPSEAPPWNEGAWFLDDDAAEPQAEDSGTGDGSALHLPLEFWDSRKVLGHIRQAAHARQRSADAVLHAVLARVVAWSDHRFLLPPTVGHAVPLCYFAVVLAAPGVGKSSASDIAAELVPLSPDEVADNLPLGTGEGVVENLFDMVTVPDPNNPNKTVQAKRQTKHNAYIYADEGAIVSKVGNRSGSILLESMNTIWTGGVIGQANATKERRRIVPAGAYVYGIVIGLQTSHAGGLLDSAALGTPQRFGWALAYDPAIPAETPPWPGPLDISRPRATLPDTNDDVLVIGAYGVTGTVSFPVAEAIVAEIKAADLPRARTGQVDDPLDAHGDLYRLKVAAALALLEGRAEVTEDDWRLAGIVRSVSASVRNSVLGHVKAEAARIERVQRGKLAWRAVAADAAVERRRVVECARKLAKKVWAEPDRWTVAELRRSPMRRYRDEFDDGLDHAVAEGWVVLVEAATGAGGSERRDVRQGPKRPPS